MRASKTLEVCVLSAMGDCVLKDIANRVHAVLVNYHKSRITDVAAYFGKMLDSTFEKSLASEHVFR